MSRLVLGVDGGATKTVALVADDEGRVRGAGRGGSSDIHAARDPSEPLDRIAAVVRDALSAAGVGIDAIEVAVFSLCGADWPEDAALYVDGLRRRLGPRVGPVVVNDAIGALRAGTSDGMGVSVVIGTGVAIGARGPGGPGGATWHSGFWMEPSGAIEFGRRALIAMVRAELGIGPMPGFCEAVLGAFGAPSIEAVLEAITRRDGLGDQGYARVAPIVLDAGHQGDPVAASIVREHATLIAEYAIGSARRVGLVPGTDFPLVLTGGVLRHHCTDLFDGIARAAPGAQVMRTPDEPVLGALLMAFDAAGLAPDLESLRRTSPSAAFFQTI